MKRGRLTVGASTTVAGYWLPPYAAEFARSFPSAELHIRAGNTRAISETLISCEIDLALVEGQVNDPRIVTSHWRDDELQIIARHDTARRRKHTREELNAQVWLLREPGSGTREVTDLMMQAEGIARAVAAGLGVTMLPARVTRELTRTGELRPLTLNTPTRALTRPLFLLQLRERPASPLVRAFCELLGRTIEKP